jgi:predicted nuclease of predicted toxin-antitoxin system
MMQFKIDENLPMEFAAMLRAAGHDAVSLLDQGLDGAGDSAVAEKCRTERRAIVTLDLDFSDIRQYPPEEYQGLIVLRVGHQEKRHLIRLFGQVIPFTRSFRALEITARPPSPSSAKDPGSGRAVGT